MKQACVEAIAQTLGRKPKADELKNIEDRIKEAVRQVSRNNAREGKTGIPDAQTYMDAAELVRQRVVHDVYKKRQRLAQNAIAISKVTDTLDAAIPPEQQTPANLQQLIFSGRRTTDRTDIPVTSAEELATGAYQDWSRQLSAELLKAGPEVQKFFEQSKALGEQRFRSLFDQRVAKSGQLQILKEIYGEDTGNPQAKKIAQVWGDVTSRARQEMNDAGFDIGQRDNWNLPYVDDADLIRNSGRDEWLASLSAAEQAKARLSGRQPPIEFAKQAWVDDVYNTQDRSQYVNLDGSPMNDIEYRQALEAIYETKATDGANKLDPGAFMGTGGIKNRGSQSRVMAFKDAQSHFAYMERYTEQPVVGVMMSHLQSSSRDLGTVKAFGPDAANNFKLINDRIYQRAVTGGKDVGKMNSEKTMVERMFNSMAGLNGVQESSVFTSAVGGLRNLMTSAMLGTSVLTATSDQAIMRANAQALGFSRGGMRLSANTIKNLFSGDAKRANAELGLLVDSHAAVVSKMGGFDLSRGITGWFAEKTLKWSGLIAMDRANKASFGLLMYKNIGELTRTFKTLDEVKGSDKTILASKGWSNEDWAIMAAAELRPMTTAGHMGMTPDAIYAVPDEAIHAIMADRIAQVRAGSETALAALGDIPQERRTRMKQAFDAEAEQTVARMVRNARAEAAQKLLGVTHGEMTSAITTATGLDTYARDDAGQLVKSFMLFKTTSFAGFRQLVNRTIDLDRVPGIKFLASYIAGTTLAGMFANQMNSLLTGNDPLDMTKPTTWIQPLLKGGSFGIYGDFLFQDHTQYGSSIAATLGGPVLSFAEQLTKLLITNPQKALQGEETSFGADALKTARMITPFANLWYAKAVTNHLILQQLQEMANPGYNDRVRDRAQREFNTTSWWEPGDTAPRRAPDLGKAVGQ
ncbi:hypothetical protein FEK48_13135 [Escherichia sp. E2593]|uniref:hypothetical protein n=1 Tax=unclassified Escherichia TaxID=2608889 RepID=UPI001028C84F|nr:MULTISPECIES: hypothetical protein [unclassified Escherichia]RZN40393.1 hypothetical protein D9738_13215 [Escherichia sp. E10V5]TGC06823.1 hypothetical protein CRG93_18460 [Escherichia sp. E2593]TLI81897.1 hypothetical protein FEK48_13135 [Escherichia sp. E2593]